MKTVDKSNKCILEKLMIQGKLVQYIPFLSTAYPEFPQAAELSPFDPPVILSSSTSFIFLFYNPVSFA